MNITGLISLCGPGLTFQDSLLNQLENNIPVLGDLREDAVRIMQDIKAGLDVPDQNIPKDLLGLFRNSIQNFIRSLIELDPADEMAKASERTSVLIIGGSHDDRCTVEDFDRLDFSSPAAKSKCIEGMLHILKSTEDLDEHFAWGHKNYLALAPLASGLVDAIAGFIKRCVQSPKLSPTCEPKEP